MGLVRKELLRPDRSATSGAEAFRFRHILVRDAAYAALPKEQRADLHARFADWLERIAGDRLLEYEEVIAYHLEQAHHYRSELGLADELTSLLGSRAAARLRAAGTRAWARHDAPAADNLISRAVDLLGDTLEHRKLTLLLSAVALDKGDFPRTRALLADASQAADRAGDELVRTHAEMLAAQVALLTDPNVDEERLLTLSATTEALAIESSDLRARVEALQVRALVSVNRCRFGDMLAALEEALPLLQGQDPESQLLRRDVQDGICGAVCYGPTSASAGIARIDQVASAETGLPLGKYLNAPMLLAMQGKGDEARRLIQAGIEYVDERGLVSRRGNFAVTKAAVELFAGDLEAAQHSYAEAIAIWEALGATSYLSTLAAVRAIVLYQLGRTEEMGEAIRLARENGSPTDIATQGAWRVAAAQRAADEGRRVEAEQLIGEAIALVEPTDFLELRGRVFAAHAHIEARAGRVAGWHSALDRALAEHERKGNLVDAKRIRDIMSSQPPAAVA